MSSAGADGGSFDSVEPKPEEARRLLHEALLSDRLAAVETFGISPTAGTWRCMRTGFTNAGMPLGRPKCVAC